MRAAPCLPWAAAATATATDHRRVQATWAADQQVKGVKDAVPVLGQLTNMVDAAQR